VAEPGQGRVLLAAAISLGAAGLNPVVFEPGFPSVQAAIRARPEVETFVIVATLLSAGLLFVGGILGDADGRRGILLGALAVLLGASLLSIVIPSGPLFLIGRFVGGAASNAALPFAFALVATTYRGVTRATAIGILYSVYGAATAVPPLLLTLNGPGGSEAPAFVASALTAAVALWVAFPRTPDLPAVPPARRSYVVATAVWAFAIVIVTVGVVGLGHGLDDPSRFVLIGLGLAMAAGYVAWDRRGRERGETDAIHLDRRPVTVAIAVGVVMGFAQAAPLFQLPLFLQIVLRYGALGATIATVPFMLALVLAGPVAGALLTRSRPRTLIAGGVGALGLGNLIAAAVLGSGAEYLALALPFVLLGGGFVVGTTIRTAVIFASVDRKLPATAAALNQASLQVGGRIGLVVMTVLVTRIAVDRYGATLGALDPGQRDAAIAAFRSILDTIGTPALGEIAVTIDPSVIAAYAAAFTEALRASLAITGLIALVTAPIAWLALGARDPLTTVWDHRDERPEPVRPLAG
jgi:DHA2 family multidrug resistance protein-like MFS transporter